VTFDGAGRQQVSFGGDPAVGELVVAKSGDALAFIGTGFRAPALTVQAGNTVKFMAGQTFRFDALKCLGATGKPVALCGTVPGTPWRLGLAKYQTFEHLDLSDCDATAGKVLTVSGGRDGGNNRWCNYGAPPRIAAPKDGAQFAAPAQVRIETEAGPEVAGMEFWAGTVLLGRASRRPVALTWGNAGPGVHTLRLRATGRDGAVTVSPAANVTVTGTAGDSAFRLRVNFQPAKRPVPEGYRVDDGSTFGDRGDGFRYGWNADFTKGARAREREPAFDARYETHVAVWSDEHAAWAAKAPNGKYRVRVVAGDPTPNPQRNFRVAVQGAVAMDDLARTGTDGTTNELTIDTHAPTAEITRLEST
jgi:hypothetical protein